MHAGKTTLVNYILNENHGKRIAVIENEFGEQPHALQRFALQPRLLCANTWWLQLTPHGENTTLYTPFTGSIPQHSMPQAGRASKQFCCICCR
jgi:hypothetical protein